VDAPKCSLLVVDDEPYLLPTLAALLASEYEVETTDSAEAAQAILARRSVDIVLTDQKMPRRTGVQLLEWVREHSPRTVRLLMTGYAEVEDAVAAINRGQVYHYLLKPWRTEELLQVLRNAAEKCHLERSRDLLLDELRRLNRDLERRVAERTRELEEANHLLRHRTAELERLALTDPLTGLCNRRAMDELVRFELKRHARYPSALTLGIIDVDHFKRINTVYLHTGGDEVLKGLARIFTGSLREVDSVGRIGGEEFLIVAAETDEEGAAHLAERIRATVAQTPLYYEGRPIALTVSLGLAVAEEGVPADYEDMMRLAAHALHLAKHRGRNRFEICRLSVPARS
jgi:diguanylate cyclase (GGDEF)-like protein